MESQYNKKVAEAVVTAGLCALATGLVGIGMEMLRQHIFKKPDASDTKTNIQK